MARRQPQAFGRYEVEERIVQRRHGGMHGLDDLLVLVRSGDREHAGMALANAAFLDAEAAGDDDAAVLGDGLADGIEALCLALSRNPQVLTTTTSAPA